MIFFLLRIRVKNNLYGNITQRPTSGTFHGSKHFSEKYQLPTLAQMCMPCQTKSTPVNSEKKKDPGDTFFHPLQNGEKSEPPWPSKDWTWTPCQIWKAPCVRLYHVSSQLTHCGLLTRYLANTPVHLFLACMSNRCEKVKDWHFYGIIKALLISQVLFNLILIRSNNHS